MTIELVDKIIKIPASENVLISTEDNPKTVIIKIPRELLTNEIANSQIFILTQINEEETRVEELTYLTDSLFYVYYQWKINRKHTQKEGKLKIQIKIVRKIPIIEEEQPEITLVEPVYKTTESEEIDPGFTAPIGIDQDGIWFSFQNEFKILNVLKPLL